jgi:hypothetical protein
MTMSTPKRTHLSLTLAIAAAWPMLGAAQPAADSAYRTDAQSTHVEDATSRGIQQVNMITCFLSSMRPDALVNQGPYNALVDQNKCDPGARSGSSASSGAGSNAPSYMSAVVDVTRSSNADPMRSKTWVTESMDGFESIIFINTSATAAPSGSNPYGVFRVDYCGKGAVGPCMMRGFLQGSASGIDYFEIEGGNGMGGGGTKALTLTTSGTDAGAGRLQMDEQGQTAAFSFAYNANYFRRSDGNADQCFARDATDPETGMSVWSYGMYSADSGARVELNSGFPIDYTSGGTTYHGHIGYWGLWLPPEANAANGATVQRVQYSNGEAPTKTDYTLVKADGRLMKYTKRTRTLAAIDKIKFQTFVGDTTNFFAGATPFQQYEMYWDNAAGVFKVTGVVECGGDNGCQTSDLPAEQSVSAAYFAPMGGARGWSQALGGELFVALAGNGGSVNSSAVQVIYREQELVYPAAMPANLFCLRDCPTAASIAAYFAPGSSAQSPFVASSFNAWGPVQPADVLSYTTDSNAALLRDANSAALTFTDREALAARPQYQSGVRTGRLFTTLAAAVCTDDNTRYCDHQVELMDEYYQWETGPNQWNQFAAVKNGSGSTVQFDAPLQVSYSVPNGAAYGAYAGKSIVLQYGGTGQLWGIPGHCVSSLTNAMVSCGTQGSRYVPAFVIPYDETLGRVSRNGSSYLVKWLDREIRFARKDPSTCAAAGLSLPSGLTLPTATGLADPSDPASSIYIGTKPTLTAAPRVIHGEVMY